jgi:hypothetical protein
MFVAVAVAVVVGLGIAVAYTNGTPEKAVAASTFTATDPPRNVPTTAPAVQPTESVASDPEKNEPTAAPQPTQSGPRDVDVFLTYAGYMPESGGVVAGGYADAVTENDGTCTLTLTKGGTTRTATGRGAPDAATTSCGELTVPQAQLSSGTWQATVSYSSPHARGTSSPFPVEVP